MLTFIGIGKNLDSIKKNDNPIKSKWKRKNANNNLSNKSLQSFSYNSSNTCQDNVVEDKT